MNDAQREKESKALRPYRRFVRIVFFTAMAILCGVILRGIIRSLDRMQGAPGPHGVGPVDVRALRACAEDLDKLDKRVRTTASQLLASNPNGPVRKWETVMGPIELDRLAIVARCRLDSASDDPVVQDLERAATGIEDSARAYRLLYDRHVAETRTVQQETSAAIRRATRALKTR